MYNGREFTHSVCTEGEIKVCTWLREISSCSCLTVLPCPAWVLLSKTYKPSFPPLYMVSQKGGSQHILAFTSLLSVAGGEPGEHVRPPRLHGGVRGGRRGEPGHGRARPQLPQEHGDRARPRRHPRRQQDRPRQVQGRRTLG